MTEEHGAYRTRCKGAPSIFHSTVMTTLKRICICSPYYSPLPFAAAMLAATPFPRGSGANLAVAGFVVGTLSDQLLPSPQSVGRPSSQTPLLGPSPLRTVLKTFATIRLKPFERLFWGGRGLRNGKMEAMNLVAALWVK